MNPVSRAHRILKQLKRYQPIDNPINFAAKAVHLGELLGVYKNDCGIVLNLYRLGLTWVEGESQNIVKYSEIVDVSTHGRKDETYLHITLNTGKSAELPVDGNYGRFFDSLEVLRYLDRVVSDIRDFPNEFK